MSSAYEHCSGNDNSKLSGFSTAMTITLHRIYLQQ